MNTIVDAIQWISVTLFVIGVPALFGGFLGEVLYAGRTLMAYRKHVDPSRLGSNNLHLWLVGWMLLLRKSPERDGVEQLANENPNVSRDLGRYVASRRIARYSLVALFVAFLL